MKKSPYAPHDFNESMLPVNRRQLFFDIYRNSFRSVFKCGAMLLLFSLPAIAWLIFMFLGSMGMTEEAFGENLDAAKLLWNIITPSGALILSIPIYLCVCGVMRVMRRLAWQEGLDFGYEFRSGLKGNAKATWPYYLITCLLFALAYAAVIVFYPNVFCYGGLLFYVLIFLPLFIWQMLLGNLYEGRFRDFIHNSAVCFGKSIGWTLLFIALALLPALCDIICPAQNTLFISIKYSVIMLMLLFYYPALLLAFLIYANKIFDETINEEHYPDYYRKGLYDLSTPHPVSGKSQAKVHSTHQEKKGDKAL